MKRREFLRVRQANPAPYLLEGGPIGVLLIHGFCGTPREMARIGNYLHARGLTVSAPCLPGHGETLDEINRTGWRDWVAGVEAAYAQLRSRCSKVVVGGHSMGALLTLELGSRHPEIAALLTYSPALRAADWRVYLTPFARHFLQSLPKKEEPDLHDPESQAWLGGFAHHPVPASAELLALQQQVRRQLSAIRQPVLVVYSTGDRAIHRQAGPETIRRLSQTVVESLVLEDSGHGVPVDREWERVAEASYQFVLKHTA